VDLGKEYARADADGRAALRARYGDAVFDELESAAWVGAHTRPCPRCGTGVLKAGGCNHIRCACGHDWCFVCGGQYQQGHFVWGGGPGTCEQYDDEFFKQLGVSRDVFLRNFLR